METKTEMNLMPKKSKVYDVIDYIVTTCPGLIITATFLYAISFIRGYILPEGLYLICVLQCGGMAMLGVVLFLQSHNVWYIDRRIKVLLNQTK